MITELEIEGFKSFGSPGIKLRLGKLNFLVGANASGKTNCLSALQFLKNVVTQDLEYAVNEMGGSAEVRNKILRQQRRPKPVRFRVKIEKEFELELGKRTWKMTSFDYEVRFDLRTDASTPVIESELLTVKLESNGVKDIFSLKRDTSKVVFHDPMQPVSRKRSKLEIPVPKGEETRLAVGVGFFAPACVLLREEIDNWRFYNVIPSAARQPCRESPDADLGSAGENLAVLLHKIEHDSTKKDLKAIIAGLQGVIPGFKGFTTKQLPVEGKWAFQVVEEKIRSGINPASVSDGTIRLLALLVITTWMAKRSSLIAIEEPENGIHPHLFEHIITTLRDTPRGRQFLVTTHNPVFLDHLEPHELFLCDKRDGFTGIQQASNIHEIEQFRKHFHLGELWVQGTLGGIL